MMAAILALHLAAVFGLLQVREARKAAHALVPVSVHLIAAPTPAPAVPPAEPPSPLRPASTKPVSAPALSTLRPAPPMFAAAVLQTPAAAEAGTAFAPVPPLVPPASMVPATAAPPALVASTPVPPLPASAPKFLPAAAVEYLVPPAPEYPRAAKRNAEAGRVIVRVFIDTAGLPAQVEVATSSGHLRLDESALQAVRRARFRPYTENGLPTAGWAMVPIDFELER